MMAKDTETGETIMANILLGLAMASAGIFLGYMFISLFPAPIEPDEEDPPPFISENPPPTGRAFFLP